MGRACFPIVSEVSWAREEEPDFAFPPPWQTSFPCSRDGQPQRDGEEKLGEHIGLTSAEFWCALRPPRSLEWNSRTRLRSSPIGRRGGNAPRSSLPVKAFPRIAPSGDSNDKREHQPAVVGPLEEKFKTTLNRLAPSGGNRTKSPPDDAGKAARGRGRPLWLLGKGIG